jgi:hypothetical protein
MKEIPLTRGLVALVDDADYEALAAHKWFADNDGYAERIIPHPTKPGKTTSESMHRVILGLEFGNPLNGEHRDLNPQNNQRYNLRPATHAENMRNRGALRNNTSGFKGVSLRKSSGKWQATISVNGRQRSLGVYHTKEAAYEVYKATANRLHGEFSRIA